MIVVSVSLLLTLSSCPQDHNFRVRTRAKQYSNSNDNDYLYQAFIVFVMRWTIWYHLYNLKNVETVNFQALACNIKPVTFGCFSRFLNCTNVNKSRKAIYVFYILFLKI